MHTKTLASKPTVSVIIPVFNGETHLQQSIESVLSQEYKHLDLIVVDDGSTDDTRAILDQYRNQLTSIRQENAGPGAARNNGIRHASGELIAFLDADDLWPRDNLSKHVEVLADNPEVEVLLGMLQCFRAKKFPTSPAVKPNADSTSDFPTEHEFSVPFYSYLFGAAVVRSHVFGTVGMIDERFKMGEDVDWFLRVRESRTKLSNASHVALHYRRHKNSMTNVVSECTILTNLKQSLDRRRASSGCNSTLNSLHTASTATARGTLEA